MRAKYIWLSDGHPDHLNQDSIKAFKEREILLPDHVGYRISDGLTHYGYRVTLLPDRKWVDLSRHRRVYCITNYMQDAVLLLDVT